VVLGSTGTEDDVPRSAGTKVTSSGRDAGFVLAATAARLLSSKFNHGCGTSPVGLTHTIPRLNTDPPIVWSLIMSNPHYGPAHPQPAAPRPRKKRTGLIVLVIVSALLLTLIGACAAVISSISNAVNGVSASEGPVVVDGDDSEAPAEEDSPKADEPADRNGGEKKAEKKT